MEDLREELIQEIGDAFAGVGLGAGFSLADALIEQLRTAAAA